MITFIVIAAAMVLAVSALIAVPLLSRRGAAPQSPWTALAVLAVLLVGAGGLYGAFSNWNWSQPHAEAADGSPQSMVASLARRLARNPDDVDGWLLLGRSYSVLQETPLAARAYERANELAKGNNVDALLGLAEALISQDDSQLAGRAGQLVERALTLAPTSPKALFYGAAAAIQHKDLPLARKRFVALARREPAAERAAHHPAADQCHRPGAGYGSAGQPAPAAAADSRQRGDGAGSHQDYACAYGQA